MTTKILGAVSVALLALVGYLAFLWLPIESTQGFVSKVLFVHVPSAWLAFFSFFVAFVVSIGYLWKREEKFDVIAVAAVEIGVIFCAITLATGAIWGKPTWNTYWTWDARLTTTLILLLIFMGYLLLRKFMDPGEGQAKASAIIAIIGFLDVPLIHQSVTWWRTLHQTSTFLTPKKNVVSPEIATVLWISVASFMVLFTYLLLSRIALEKKKRKLYRSMAEEH